MKPERYNVLKTNSRLLNSLQSSISVSLFVHWVFQGMLNMDRTERLFKLSIDGAIAGLVVAQTGYSPAMLGLGLLVGHTFNFVFNAQINVVLKCFGISRANQRSLTHYLESFGRRVEREPSIWFAAAYGSMSRNELRDTSDIDIRVIRSAGFIAAVRSCGFAALERCRALFTGIPLDIFVLDDRRGLSKLRVDEPAVVLKDVKYTGRPVSGNAR